MKIVTIARIYIKEGDKIENHNLMQEIFKLLHDQHKVHGVTVFRGVAGFGSRGAVHADDLLRLVVHLPLVLEFYDDPEAWRPCCRASSKWCPPGISSPGRRSTIARVNPFSGEMTFIGKRVHHCHAARN